MPAAYQLDYLAVLKALFVPFSLSSAVLAVLPISAAIILPLFFLLRELLRVRRGSGETAGPHYMLMLIGASVIIPAVVVLGSSLPLVGAGWRLDGDVLQIKAQPVSASIEVKKAKVALLSLDGLWQPVLRANGYGTPGLATGWFKLKNGKKAAYFRHLRPSEMVLIEWQGSYYLIAHPGVKELYNLLVTRGAAPGSF